MPWRRPWRSRGVPRNLFSLKPYRGINVWLLLSRPYTSPFWLTFRQAQEIGGTVRKGEKGTPIVFWKFADDQQNDDREQQGSRSSTAPLVRTYTVFNTEQCLLPQSLTERLDATAGEIPEPISACEHVLATMPHRPTIEHGGDRAYYSPTLDTVCVPHRSQFISAEEYYATIFHELVHSSGSVTRLARPSVIDAVSFASHERSKEELIAEFGAAFLCGSCGIAPKTLENSAAYIAYWVATLRNDKTFLIQAASQAQRAVDFILNAPMSKDTDSETTS